MRRVYLILFTVLFVFVVLTLPFFLFNCGKDGIHFNFVGSGSCPVGNGEFHFEKLKATFLGMITDSPILILLALSLSYLIFRINRLEYYKNPFPEFNLYHARDNHSQGMKPLDPLLQAMTKGILNPKRFGEEDV